MKRLYPLMVLLVICIFLPACSPSESDISTAIAMTQLAMPSDTPSPIPPPTSTSTPAHTETPTPTPTSTPDLRVINVDPRKLLLEKGDLPSEGKYYLPNSSWISPHRNSEIISGWGVEEGREYLEKTGRVDGWWAAYARGTRAVLAPEEIYDNVVLYRTHEGALLIISEFSQCRDPENGFTLIEEDLNIGDATNVCIDIEMQPSGKNRVWYRIEFLYRNIFHAVIGWGWEEEVTLEFVEGIARVLLSKLEAAPLSDKVTFEP